ncbi:hypothetical protein JCM1393_08010 [Clostridium carnis]
MNKGRRNRLKRFSFTSLIVVISLIFGLLYPPRGVLADESNIVLSLTTTKKVIQNGEEVEFFVEYKLKNGPGAIKEGDILEVKLPDVFTDIRPTYPLEHFSSVKVDGTTIKATFGKGAETAIGGYIKIKAVASNVKETKVDKVTAQINGVIQSINIKVNPTPPDNPTIDRMLLKSIVSSYSYEGSGPSAKIVPPLQGKPITQVIYINEKRSNLNNVTVVDNMPDGTELITDSVKITEILANGDKIDATEKLRENITLNKNELKLVLTDTNSIYNLEYSMKIVANKKEYINTAKLTDDNGENIESKTIVRVKEDDTIIKKHSDYETRFVQGIGEKVNYSLYINLNNKDLTDISLEDNIPEGMELLKEEGIKIGEYDIAGKFNWVTDKYKYNLEANKVSIKFGDSNKKYVVYYTTKVTDRRMTYTNIAKLNYDSTSTSIEDVVRYEVNSGAINAIKKVDTKAIKKGDSQKVKYSIDISCYGYFQKGYIKLTDVLDKNVKIENVEVSKNFTYKIDKENNSVIVTNNNDLEYNEKVFVNILTDFTNVPDGTTIENAAAINGTTTNKVTTKKGYAFKAKKVDSDNNNSFLQGAKFSLQDEDGEEIKVLTSDANGIITSSLEDDDKYYLQEIQAPNGYVINNNKISFTINDDDLGSVLDIGNIGNRKKRYEVIIKNVDSEDSNRILKGATFEITNEKGETFGPITIGKDGIGTINLVPGNYKLSEITAPKGYLKLNEVKNIEVKSGETKAIEIVINNMPIKGKVTIIKKDADDVRKLIGAEFEITDLLGNNITTVVTDENGIATVELRPGIYNALEIKAPDGYIKSIKPQIFIIKEKQDKAVELVFENRKDKYEVTIKKVDSVYKNKVLEGAKFIIKDVNSNFIEHLITDKDGLAKIMLVPGKYKIEEIEAPNGYIKESESKYITIEQGEVKDYNITLTNTIKEENPIQNNTNKDDNKNNPEKDSNKNNINKENQINKSDKDNPKKENNKNISKNESCNKDNEKNKITKEIPYTGAVLGSTGIVILGVASLALGYFLIRKK